MFNESKVSALLDAGLSAKSTYQPDFFRLGAEADKNRFSHLLELPGIVLHDQLYDQLKELFKSRNPEYGLKEEDYSRLIAAHLNGCPVLEYGVWVYYPWSGKVVHLLDEQEFIEVRTAANRNKITTPERDILAKKKVGVIGLSVGQSVSVTLALERSCGELRLADFDTLELNNLNRIRTGVHNLGLLKAHAVAREIAEIDPFFKVVCYTEGITEDNIHGFFTDGGKLDAVIDECDGVHIKILCRQKAKELSVPVLMEASDRGTLDVERFDLEPDRPIMHGWLEHLAIDFNVLKNLKTTEEKIPYILPISGLDTLSARMKASMVEIENTLTTWPQLATAVTLGGAITADTCRRIFLDQYTGSGRFFIDMEQLLPDERPKKVFEPQTPPEPISAEEMDALATAALRGLPVVKSGVSSEVITSLVTEAIAAPTAGNNQPWRWLYRDNSLFLFHDRHRSFSFGDFEDIASHVGLGAAIENLELAAYNKQLGATIHYFPVSGSGKLVATIQFTPLAGRHTLYQPAELYPYIGQRATNRNLGTRAVIGNDVYEQLKLAVASVPGAELIIKDNPDEMNKLAEIMGAADRLRLLHAEGHNEFYNKELRWSPEQSRITADGIDLATVDISPLEIVGLKMVKDPRVMQYLIDWNAGAGLKKTARKAVAASSAIALVTMPEFSPISFVMGGRAVERMWLKATELNVSLQPLAAAILHFARLNHGGGMGMPDFMKNEFTQLYSQFGQLFPGIKDKGEIFLCRLCIANKPVVKSFRIPVDKMLTFG